MRPHQGAVRQELDQAAEDLPWAVGGAAVSAFLPGFLSKVAPYAPRAAQAVAKVASSPTTYGATGAVEGYRRGGLWGALTGGASGYGLAKGLGALSGGGGPDVAAGMSQAGRAATAAKSVSAQAGVEVPMLDALQRGASFDEMLALAQGQAPKAAVSASAAPAASTIESELMARQTLEKPINWRTQDVTPIKKPGPGIHFGEESTPGLLKMLQDALVSKNKTLAQQIETAIRQRSHITGKVGEP